MATFIQTDELNGTKVPSSATGILKDGWGIDATLAGFIIQNMTVTRARTTDQTQDQKGAVIGELDYDEREDLTLDVIGNTSSSTTDMENALLTGATVGDTAFSFNGKTWKIDNVTFTGTFNDKKKWQITAHRYVNFPGSSLSN